MVKKTVLAVLAAALTAGLYAYIPENTSENSFAERVVAPFYEVTDLVNDGIKAVRQEVVSSTYESKRSTKLGGGLEESESGKEEVTARDILYYEPKEEIYEAAEIMEEILIWLTMYRTTEGDDVVAFRHLRRYVDEKKKALNALIKALKYEKDNKDTVMKSKLKMKSLDRDFKRYMKRLKGKIKLIEGKPLPEPVGY
ncbi:MAG TPA: hypothetical protein ENN43_03065 [bacterium]|nr:hypothetical protein [bacterium]